MNKNALKKNAIYITLTAMLAAILVLGKLTLAVVPNVEIVTLCLLVFSAVFPLRMSFTAVVVFCLLDPLIYGFRPDVFLQYILHYPIFCLIAWFCFRFTNKKWTTFVVAMVLTALASVAFWLETPLIYTLMFNYRFDIYAKLGIPFFLSNIISNVIVVGLIFLPLVIFFKEQTAKLFRKKVKTNCDKIEDIASDESLVQGFGGDIGSKTTKDEKLIDDIVEQDTTQI